MFNGKNIKEMGGRSRLLAIGARNMCLFSFSMFVLSGVMYAWLAVRKSDRDRRLPLIPVLTAAYVMTIILGGGVY